MLWSSKIDQGPWLCDWTRWLPREFGVYGASEHEVHLHNVAIVGYKYFILGWSLLQSSTWSSSLNVLNMCTLILNTSHTKVDLVKTLKLQCGVGVYV